MVMVRSCPLQTGIAVMHFFNRPSIPDILGIDGNGNGNGYN